MTEFKIRASAIGKIMTGTVGLTAKQEKKLQGYYKRTKPLTDNMKEEVAKLEQKRDNPELSKICINYLYEWWINQKYGRSKEITTKYTDKGLAKEEDSITLLSRVDERFYEKNEEHFSDDYMTGTPDIVTNEVIDLKTSWDIFTFFQSQIDPLNTDYEYQLQSYMHLTGNKKARLVYCLVDTPSLIIDKEVRGLEWKGMSQYSSEFLKAEHEIVKRSTYGDIPIEERVYSVELEYNPKTIEEIKERVEICRDWIDKNLDLSNLDPESWERYREQEEQMPFE